MNQERLIWQGQKQEKTQAAKKLELSITGLIHSIRTEINPHAPLAEMNQELIAEQAFELSDKLIQYKALIREIEAINTSLGIN